MAFVQKWAKAQNSVAGLSKQSGNPLTGNPTVGNSLIIPIATARISADPAVSSITDSIGGNTYEFISSAAITVHGTNHDNCEFWWCKSIAATGANFKITVNFANNSYTTFYPFEWAGLDTAGTLVGAHNNNSNASSPSSGAFTTLYANSLVVLVVCDEQLTALTDPASYTNLDSSLSNATFMDGLADYNTYGSIQTNLNPTCSGQLPTGSGVWIALAAAFKIAGGSTGFLPESLGFNSLTGIH